MAPMKGLLRKLAYAATGLVALVVVAVLAVYAFSEVRLRKQFAVAAKPLAIPTDSAALARGAHLAQSIAGCIGCHGDKLEGKPVIDNPAIGRIVAVNLTSGKGGIGGMRSDADYVRAIRHGIAANGRGLKIMPSSDYMNLSDADLAAIISYVKSLPPVDNELPSQRVGPVGRALLVAGKLPLIHAERIDHGRVTSAVPAAATAEYGGYLAGIGCKGCHGPALAGGKISDGDPAWPPASNLTPAGSTKNWTEAEFRMLLREGKRPGGFSVNEAMPWRMHRNMTDDEISALWLYLKSIPAAPTPGSTATN